MKAENSMKHNMLDGCSNYPKSGCHCQRVIGNLKASDVMTTSPLANLQPYFILREYSSERAIRLRSRYFAPLAVTGLDDYPAVTEFRHTLVESYFVICLNVTRAGFASFTNEITD
tara:strand:+ start:32339 stop:32683 length:345 start_codon:yes stop_codon:yes gene_type:complete